MTTWMKFQAKELQVLTDVFRKIISFRLQMFSSLLPGILFPSSEAKGTEYTRSELRRSHMLIAEENIFTSTIIFSINFQASSSCSELFYWTLFKNGQASLEHTIRELNLLNIHDSMADNFYRAPTWGNICRRWILWSSCKHSGLQSTGEFGPPLTFPVPLWDAVYGLFGIHLNQRGCDTRLESTEEWCCRISITVLKDRASGHINTRLWSSRNREDDGNCLNFFIAKNRHSQ